MKSFLFPEMITSLINNVHKLSLFYVRIFSTSAIYHTQKICVLVAFIYSAQIFAQSTTTVDSVYQKVISERTVKIVTTLGITNATAYKQVHQQLIDQYFKLNIIHDQSKLAVTAIKLNTLSKDEITAALKKEDSVKLVALKQLHSQFLAQLKNTLSTDQIEKVKNGMTYSILPVTWTAYLEMLQNLTTEQKTTMYAWLLEARELAMDEGSSEKKHAVFGKYKGRINNFLSAAGYDMKKEGEEWAKRIKAAKEAKQQLPN